MHDGKLYLIQLDLRADSERAATDNIRNKPNETTYLENDIVIISTTAQEYNFLFKADVSEGDLRLTLFSIS